jgi:hypothetical protein
MKCGRHQWKQPVVWRSIYGVEVWRNNGARKRAPARGQNTAFPNVRQSGDDVFSHLPTTNSRHAAKANVDGLFTSRENSG